MKNYPKWEHGTTPHTDYNAKISSFRYEINVRVIKTEGAIYRGAVLTGVFEIVSQTNNENLIIFQPSGKRKIKVICSWHGVIPPNTYPNIDLTNATFTILENYTGQVADNIS
jgi:hypothetical protein